MVGKAFIFSAALCLGCRLASFGQLKVDTARGYKLAWADEFNNEGAPDSTNWRFEQGFIRNHEDQWYQAQNAVCHKGMLIITAEKVHQPNPDYKAGSNNWKTNREFIEYTSASLNTRGLHSWQYGRMVMRARIGIQPGLWPAFWTLGESHPWPSNGEIDIMEFYQGKLLANIACGTATPYKAKWYSNTKPVNELGGKKWARHFIYGAWIGTKRVSVYM